MGSLNPSPLRYSFKLLIQKQKPVLSFMLADFPVLELFFHFQTLHLVFPGVRPLLLSNLHFAEGELIFNFPGLFLIFISNVFNMLFILPVDDVGRFFLFRFLDKRKTTFFSIPQILVDFIMLPLCLLGGLVKFVAFGLEVVNQSGNAGAQPSGPISVLMVVPNK